jgi:MSHA biogenesis protein MshN
VSVINKMLRDLDSRQDLTKKPRESMVSDLVIVNDSDGTGRSRGSLYLGTVLIIVLVGAAGAWWYTKQTGSLLRKPEQTTLVVPPAMNQPMTSAAPRAESVVTLSPPPAIVNSDNPQPEAAIEKSPVVAELLAVASSPTISSRPDATGTPLVVSDKPMKESPATLVPATPAATIAAPQISQRRSPALDALAQAQSLWSAGSRQAAKDLLRKALAATERANPVGTPSGNHPELVLLARELARMYLIEGQADSTLGMLTRLEPALSGFADVWAIRGNAAQRLGRHQESGEAYLMALELRPNEPRWMLGAAVSLAAQGRTVIAAELAEKARAEGVLSLEVATYLRQLGVPLRDR